MASYLQRFDATPAAARWPLARGWIFGEPLPFFAELRQVRPILVMPEVTLATRFDDCTEILRYRRGDDSGNRAAKFAIERPPRGSRRAQGGPVPESWQWRWN